MATVDEQAALLDSLEAAVLALLQAAPAGSPAQLADAAAIAFTLAHAVAAGEGATEAKAEQVRGERVGLICAMERCLELIGDGLVDAGVALPALAMAAHTARSSAPGAAAAIAAARYEIETLLPAPGSTPAPRKGLDVSVQSLVRRPRPLGGDASMRGRAAREQLASSWPAAARRVVERARQRLR